jgi:dolichol-phosphate mannosyltransferase
MRRVGPFDVTVVVPTRNERDNVAPLLRRLEPIRPDLWLEVLFIDDSSDDTPRVIEAQARQCSRTVSLIHRLESERTGGLGGAVRAGLLAARSDLVCVMDADLQHPPELLAALIDEASRSRADLVIASRYRDRGDVGELSAFRLAVSRGSAIVAKALFARRLRSVSDPMSGFFLIRRSAVDAGALRPEGFKILLETLVSGSALVISEVPFRFGERHSGDSKASWHEGVTYLRRLAELRIEERWRRLAAGKRASRRAVISAHRRAPIGSRAASQPWVATPPHPWSSWREQDRGLALVLAGSCCSPRRPRSPAQSA